MRGKSSQTEAITPRKNVLYDKGIAAPNASTQANIKEMSPDEEVQAAYKAKREAKEIMEKALKRKLYSLFVEEIPNYPELKNNQILQICFNFQYEEGYTYYSVDYINYEKALSEEDELLVLDGLNSEDHIQSFLITFAEELGLRNCEYTLNKIS